MVASKEGAGQRGPVPIAPGFPILTPVGDLTRRDMPRGAGRRGREGRGCRGGEPPEFQSPQSSPVPEVSLH